MAEPELWHPPVAAAPVRATVRLPGSKSVTNRALVLAALADGESRLRRPLVSRDTALMAGGLRALGVPIRADGDDLRVTGCPAPLRPAGGQIAAGNAGTVARFLTAVAPLAAGTVTLDGDPRIRCRPMRPLIEALRELGAELDDGGRGGLPVTVHGRGSLAGGAVTLDASTSSQHLSALLLAGPHCRAGVRVRHAGGRLPSAHHLAMTVAMLRDFGAHVDGPEPGAAGPAGRPGPGWSVAPGPLRARPVEVEPDLSTAAPFLAAAVATAGEVRVPGWPVGSRQPGAVLPDLLAAMGGSVEHRDGGLTVRGGGRVRGLDADLGDVSELTPVLAALAALADSPSRLSGIAHQRGQETDRLAALAGQLGGLGAEIRETADGLEIWPAPLHAGTFRCFDDHRLVMAAAVVGLLVPGVTVPNPATVAKTMPDFVRRWAEIVGPPAEGSR